MSPASERSPSFDGPRRHVSWSPGLGREASPQRKGGGKKGQGGARYGRKGGGGRQEVWKGGR